MAWLFWSSVCSSPYTYCRTVVFYTDDIHWCAHILYTCIFTHAQREESQHNVSVSKVLPNMIT